MREIEYKITGLLGESTRQQGWLQASFVRVVILRGIIRSVTGLLGESSSLYGGLQVF